MSAGAFTASPIGTCAHCGAVVTMSGVGQVVEVAPYGAVACAAGGVHEAAAVELVEGRRLVEALVAHRASLAGPR